MALVLRDRVKETTTTTGTGTVTLAGAVTGFQSFSVIGNANTTYYCIAHQTANEWEVGIGTYTSAGTTLSRDTVLESSNAGSLVTFSAGTKDVFVTYPAERSIYADGTTLQTTNSAVLPVASGGTGATAGNAAVNNLQAYTTTVTSGVLTSLTSASTYYQYFTGTATQTCALPDVTTLALGRSYEIVNLTNNLVTLTSSGLNSLGLIYPNMRVKATCIALTGTTGASWNATYMGASTNTGFGALVFGTSPSLVTPALGTPSSGNLTNCTGYQGANVSGTVGTATNVAGGAANQIHYQTGAGATSFITAPTTSSTYLSWNGTAFAWAAAGGGATITDDTTTNATYYPSFLTATSGTLGGIRVSSTKFTFNPSTGALVSTSVAASSDERHKTNWRPLAPDFISQLAQVKHGVYDRTDAPVTQVGVSAQSLASVLKHAVIADKEGMLSVEYGNAALVACIELAKEVVELREALRKCTKL